MKTPKKRIEDLEKTMPNTNEHEYTIVVGLNIENRYFRDDEPITRDEYMAEAPKEPGKITVNWGCDENDK